MAIGCYTDQEPVDQGPRRLTDVPIFAGSAILLIAVAHRSHARFASRVILDCSCSIPFLVTLAHVRVPVAQRGQPQTEPRLVARQSWSGLYHRHSCLWSGSVQRRISLKETADTNARATAAAGPAVPPTGRIFSHLLMERFLGRARSSHRAKKLEFSSTSVWTASPEKGL